MKKGNYLLLIVGAFLVFGSVSCTYYTNPNDPIFVPPPPEPGYIGSQGCAGCHEETYNSFITTGHPYILNQVENNEPPTYPNTTVDFLPPHFAAWDDVSYVIGGFAWKYQFTDSEGFIYTGDDAQYNFTDEMAVPYRAEEAPGSINFDCGKCHTTGWISADDGGVPEFAGMDGEFFAAGVQCEACHGMGSIHASSQSAEDIIIDIEASACGSCHSRNDGAQISAADGFISNYSQYDEMLSTAHSEFSCITCHDPHASVKHGETAGISQSCTDCHADMNNPTHHGADCLTCHMPYASKSATSTNKYVADIKTHIFKINPAADGEMFNEDGTIANGSDGVTLGYTCYQCHKDLDGIGGNNSTKTLEILSQRATGYHD